MSQARQTVVGPISSKLHAHQEIKGSIATSAPTTVLDFGMVLGFFLAITRKD